MKHISIFAFLFSLTALAFVGCSSGGGTNPPDTTTNPNKVTITSNDTARFYTTRRDSNDVNDPSKGDTIYQHVLSTNASAYSKTGVTALLNVRKKGVTDTTYLYQDANGNVWRYNYGIDILNTDSTIKTYLGKHVDVGWVLMDSTKATIPGNAWFANASTLNGTVSVDLLDTGAYHGDTTITLSGKNYHARHLVHSVKALAGNGLFGHAYITIDTYFAPSAGTMLDIIHTCPAVFGTTSYKMQGIYTVMVSHN